MAQPGVLPRTGEDPAQELLTPAGPRHLDLLHERRGWHMHRHVGEVDRSAVAEAVTKGLPPPERVFERVNGPDRAR